MKPKPLSLLLIGMAALGGWLALPRETNAQADAEATAVATLLTELVAQQTVIAENQTRIDEKIAAIAEEIRVARIYAGRGGGKAR